MLLHFLQLFHNKSIKAFLWFADGKLLMGSSSIMKRSDCISSNSTANASLIQLFCDIKVQTTETFSPVADIKCNDTACLRNNTIKCLSSLVRCNCGYEYQHSMTDGQRSTKVHLHSVGEI